MSESSHTPAVSGSIDYRLLVPLLLNTVVVQTVVAIVRITTSYRAIELELSAVWLGVISAAIAVLPLIFAVPVGRFIDRGHDALAMWIGSALLVVVCLGYFVWSTMAGLIACTALLGLSQLFVVAGQQIVCVRCAPNHLEQTFGYYMVANAIGQAVGPYAVGWLGGGATVPPTESLFAVALGVSVWVVVFALAVRPQRVENKAGGERDVIPLFDLLRVPGLKAMVMLGVISVTSQDLLIVYLPLFGSERHIDVADIGMLLTVRAGAAMVARFLYGRIVIATGRDRLMLISSVAAALAFAALVLPMPLWLLALAIAVIGFTIGLTATLSVTGLIMLVAPGARATANSLRMVGNRIGQLVFPFGGGLVAAASGVGGIFVILGAGLAAVAAAHWRSPTPPRPPG